MSAGGYEGDIAIDADEEVENGKNDVLEIDLTQNRACESVRTVRAVTGKVRREAQNVHAPSSVLLLSTFAPACFSSSSLCLSLFLSTITPTTIASHV